MINFIEDIFQSEAVSGAVIKTAAHGSFIIKGIFNNDVTEKSLSGFRYSSGDPYFFCKTSDVINRVNARDEITIEGENDGKPFFVEHPIQHGSGQNKGLTKLDLRLD